MHVAIIGNGISGITTARFIRKLDSNAKITVISAETDHFFSRTALMYIYMGHMRYEDTKPYEDWFWDKNRIDLLRDYVEKIDTQGKRLKLSNSGDLKYDKLVLAVGSKSNKFGWPGQDLNRVNGLYSYQDLEAMEAASEGLERAVIVGGGLIGIEMAEMFHTRNIPVTLLVREKSYWNNVLPPEESAMVSRHIKANHIDLRLGDELKEIIDDGNGNACAVITKSGERIDCGYVGLTAGVSPNISFVKNTDIETGRGILVDNHLETSVRDVYAVGDCAQLRDPRPGRRPIEAVWYTGRMAGETAAYNICGKKVSYDPGVWFNSAKFIDIEYQVYGDVRNAPQEGETALYWEHPDGDKAVRILYKIKDKSIVGFNLMGIRYRHEVCEKWIKNGTHVEQVLQDLKLANFDPEFYDMYEEDIIRQYNQQAGTNLKSKKKRSLRQVLSFLRS
ncbi:MAG: NAD(P)/FAD-dependent oxidoreductase [Saprospiraceae bacterium]